MAKKSSNQKTKPAAPTSDVVNPPAKVVPPLTGSIAPAQTAIETSPLASKMIMPAGGNASEVAESQSRAMVVASMEMIRGSMQMAREYPRNEMGAYARILGACTVPSFAEKGLYSWDVGKDKIEGPTVYLLKEIAKMWGNNWSGFNLIADSHEARTLRCFAWDLERGVRFEADATFSKVVFRKYGGNREGGEWRTADERELLQLTNAMGSRGVRNCIQSVVPDYIVSEAIAKVKETQQAEIQRDPKAFLKQLVFRFGQVGVTDVELADFVGFELLKLNAEQLRYLNGVIATLEDGSFAWTEYLAKKAKKEGVAGDSPPKTSAELKDRIASKKAAGKTPEPAKPDPARPADATDTSSSSPAAPPSQP